MSLDEFYPERDPEAVAKEVYEWFRSLRPGAYPQINDWVDFLTGIADWSMLRGCFTRGIAVGDADGIAEANGRLLLLDRKSLQASRSFKTGQLRMFRAFARRGDTAIVFWCDDPAGTDIADIRVYGPGRDGRLLNDPSLERLRHEVVRWFLLAEESPAA